MQEAEISTVRTEYPNRLACKVHMTCRTHDFLLCDTLSIVVEVDENHMWSAHHSVLCELVIGKMCKASMMSSKFPKISISCDQRRTRISDKLVISKG